MDKLLSYDPINYQPCDYKELKGSSYKLHPLCDAEGGIKMLDKDGIIPEAINLILK